MLRHKGKNRTAAHNLRLAIMLSFVAGLVNITGVLHIGTLTTNVTGHFAFFAEQLIDTRHGQAAIFLLYIVAFLGGAFFSNFLIELINLKKPEFSHFGPMFLETALLMVAGLHLLPAHPPFVLAAVLLFAMGLQNSLVTSVSSSVVRTTHLTGLFTDLGIELSQLIFYRSVADRQKLKTSLFLRSMIIVSFFAGCVSGGFAYLKIHVGTLVLAACLLLCALLYDNIRYRFYYLRRKMRLNEYRLSRSKETRL